MQKKFLLGLLVFLLAVPLFAATPSRFHQFAQVADGGGFRMTFFIAESRGVAATGTLRFWANDGSALAVTVGSTTASSFPVTLAARGSVTFQTTSSASSIRTGWAELTMDSEVGAEALFEQLSSTGQLITSAAVESPIAANAFTIPIQLDPNNNTGIAIANISGSGGVLIRLRLLTFPGVEFAQVTLPPFANREQRARFVNELFTGLGIFIGTMRIEASQPISVVVLRLSGSVLTTLPVIEDF